MRCSSSSRALHRRDRRRDGRPDDGRRQGYRGRGAAPRADGARRRHPRVLATQRPSVDVITGTIKANFPTRISFQVTSKIDSRTILGEQGAEQLLGQGDMLYMAGGGASAACTGPSSSDDEVEKVVRHLKRRARRSISKRSPRRGTTRMAIGLRRHRHGRPEGNDLYQQAVQIVLRDRKASTSYGQQVDQDVVGVEVEEVVPGRLERGVALLDRRQPDGLDRMDPERLDDRPPAVHGAEDRGAARGGAGLSRCRAQPIRSTRRRR